MMLNVAVPAGWHNFERQIGDQPIRQVVEQFALGIVNLPRDPGEGPEVLPFALDDNIVHRLGGRQVAEVAVRRVLAAFVADAQGVQVAEVTQQSASRVKAISPSVLLALAMVLPIVAFCLLLWLAGRTRGAADAVAPADFANWQSGTGS